MTRTMRTLLRCLALLVVALAADARAQTPPAGGPPVPPGQPPVTVTTDGRTITFTPRGTYDQVSLRVAAPDGRVFDVRGSNGPIALLPSSAFGPAAPDGSYTWEIRLTSRGAVPPALIARAKRGREEGDLDTENALRHALARAVLVHSGGFRIAAGKLYAGQDTEPTPPGRRIRQARGLDHRLEDAAVGIERASLRSFAERPLRGTMAMDQVIADDLIVQGSECVGLDCVNNESFGFDTIRLKENNLRIKFDDTSTSAGFPSNDWQLTANDSASGGLSKFSVDDITNARTPFTIEASTPTNALYVDSTGRIGFRTATPVLDLHVNTGDTPAIRQEQNSSGGFGAQTWDIGANEANWFVRDVTGGSRLPFRIRPGAPTSSIDINATGRVGIGTASPQAPVHLFGNNTADVFMGFGPNPGGSVADQSAMNIGYGGSSFARGVGFINVRPDTGAVAPNPSLRFMTGNTERMIITNVGNIGIGTSTPNAGNTIEAASGARLSAGGMWLDSSSRAVKERIQPLAAADARGALIALSPVTFVYRAAPSERHVGFIAEDVPDLVATADRKALSPMDIVAVLTRVVQEQQQSLEAQQRQIADLAARLSALEGARRR